MNIWNIDIKSIEDVKKVIDAIEFDNIVVYKSKDEEKYYKKPLNKEELEEILKLVTEDDYVIVPF